MEKPLTNVAKLSILDVYGVPRYASSEKHGQLKQGSDCNKINVCDAEFEHEIIFITVHKKQHTLLK